MRSLIVSITTKSRTTIMVYCMPEEEVPTTEFAGDGKHIQKNKEGENSQCQEMRTAKYKQFNVHAKYVYNTTVACTKHKRK